MDRIANFQHLINCLGFFVLVFFYICRHQIKVIWIDSFILIQFFCFCMQTHVLIDCILRKTTLTVPIFEYSLYQECLHVYLGNTEVELIHIFNLLWSVKYWEMISYLCKYFLCKITTNINMLFYLTVKFRRNFDL